MTDKTSTENKTPLFFRVFRLSPKAMRRSFLFLFAAMLLLAFVETATVGLIVFFAAAVSDPTASIQLPAIKALKEIPFISPFIQSPKAMIGSLSILMILTLPLKNGFRGWVTYRIARYSCFSSEVDFRKL